MQIEFVYLGHSLNTDDKGSILSATITQCGSSFSLFGAGTGHI